jgi:hypothetical protein
VIVNLFTAAIEKRLEVIIVVLAGLLDDAIPLPQDPIDQLLDSVMADSGRSLECTRQKLIISKFIIATYLYNKLRFLLNGTERPLVARGGGFKLVI